MATKQLHPNGQRAITIREVQSVYNHQPPIPVACYPFKKPRPQAMVTPAQVAAAQKQHKATRPVNVTATTSAQPLQTQPVQTQPALQPQQPRQAKQLHPNGRRLIAIRDVKRVYKHPRAIPVRCYPFKTPGPQSKVTPEQVVAASTQHDAEPPSDPSDSSDSESGPGWSNQFDAEASDEYDEGLRELVREIDTAFGCVPQGGLWDQYDSD